MQDGPSPLRRARAVLERHGALSVAVSAALFWAAVLSLLAASRYGGDLRAFLCFGERFDHPAALADVPRTSAYGYDGQYYAALATDPLMRDAVTERSLDAPEYRATRILLPGLAHLLAFGDDRLAVRVYQVLCWALALAAIWLAAGWLQRDGHSPLWALPLAVSGGVAVSMIRSTPDAAALAFVLAALALHRGGRWRWAAALSVAAVLARETSLLIAPVLAVAEARRRRPLPAAVLAAAPLAALLVWRGALALRDGSSVAGLGNFSLPFLWLPGKLLSLVNPGVGLNHMEFFGVLAIAATCAALVALLARPRELGTVEGTFVAFAVMGLFLSTSIYVEAFSYARVLVALPFLAAIAGERRRDEHGRWLLRAVVLLYALVGLVALRGEVRGAPAAADVAPPRPTPTAAVPQPTAAPAPTATPAPLPPLLVLPAAHSTGHDGAQWRTELVLESRSATAATVTVELLLAGRDNRKPSARRLSLQPGERLAWADAVGELFAAQGAGALRVLRGSAEVAARARTYNAAAAAPRGKLLNGVPANAAFGPLHPVRLPGLAHDPAAKTRKRTHLGVLNLSAAELELEIRLLDNQGASLGEMKATLQPLEIRQINDLFEKVGSVKAAIGEAIVTTRTPGGSFLAYASVVRRQPAGVSYVLPQPPTQVQ